MHTHGMTLRVVLETGVIDQIGTTVFGSNDGVVALLTLSKTHQAPVAIGTEDVDAARITVRTEVLGILRIDGTRASGILVGTVGLLGAEHAHLVTAGIGVIRKCRQHEAVAHEQVVIAVDILNV